MAILSDANRQRIWRGIMRWWSRTWAELSNMNKQDIRDAVDATDQWIDDNQGAFNSALPVNFRTNATLDQKTLMFCAVALMRVSGDFLKSIFGEVD